TSAQLAPPNAELLHRARRTSAGRGVSWATGSGGLLGRAPRWLRVGGTAPRSRHRMVAIASSTPAAPWPWPRKLLLELTGTLAARSPSTAWMARHSAGSLAAVPVPWALT